MILSMLTAEASGSFSAGAAVTFHETSSSSDAQTASFISSICPGGQAHAGDEWIAT